MKNIYSKTLQDLEFDSVLALVGEFCQTELGRSQVLAIKPFTDADALLATLSATSEFLSSFESQNAIPAHHFEDISADIHLLSVEGTMLEASAFKRIKNVSQTVNAHLLFFQKFQDYYPSIAALCQPISFTKEIENHIDKVFDRFGEVKDDASPSLQEIRQEISAVRLKIGQSFSRALAWAVASDYLDDIRESVIENRRVLAVKAMHRRKVKGGFLGTSKTGSIVYIEPEATQYFSRELDNLLHQERQEIERILRQLTDFLRPFAPLLTQYQQYLIQVDVLYAKARFAQKTQSILPEITQERILFLKEAYHPLLLLSNHKKGVKTYPQTISLSDTSRIIVISGPNAGGKSITLKTIGLLQVMLQSGMLVPVHRQSKMCLFERILTDIGDNQSIENHLSTYSYRLKNMNYFLKKCNAQTLFLIDEFGTGSDPELGGALAEVFLEEFYHRKAFGVITTHYANLKMLANELEFATNANMLFDNKTLEPIYRLIVGEAGSSFTFEVAQKNGIPFSLINRAKKKIEKGKVRFDATIARLQKERSQMEKTASSLKEKETKAREEAQKLEHLNQKIQTKLSNYQELYDHNQRMIYLGNKVEQLMQRYGQDNKRRPLISEFLKIVQTENAKRKPQNKEEKKQETIRKEATTQEVAQKIAEIRQQKKQEKAERKAQEQAQKVQIQQALKIGDRVRIKDGKSVGTLENIEKNKALLNYGIFTTWVDLDQLELVQKAK